MNVELKRAPRRYSGLRLQAFKGIEWVSAALGGRAFYRATQLSARRLRVRRIDLPARGAAAGFEGLRLCQLTDFHAGPFLGRGDLKPLVAKVNALKPDLVLLTGDFITRCAEEAFELADDLALLKPRLGCFAVFGNHDYRERREGEIEERLLAAANVRFLRNSGARVEWRSGRMLHLTGVEDVEEGKVCDLEAARAELRDGDLELSLVHNPLGAPAMVGPQTLAVFSGHTHGHQVNLPWVRRLGPDHPGAVREHDGAYLICSCGIGALGIPLRIRARAEVLFVAVGAAPVHEVAA